MERNGSADIRLRYFYRSLILHGKARISLEAARRLVGPDCAYHLYARLDRLAPARKAARRS
jgi:hypothetical protein